MLEFDTPKKNALDLLESPTKVMLEAVPNHKQNLNIDGPTKFIRKGLIQQQQQKQKQQMKKEAEEEEEFNFEEMKKGKVMVLVQQPQKPNKSNFQMNLKQYQEEHRKDIAAKMKSNSYTNPNTIRYPKRKSLRNLDKLIEKEVAGVAEEGIKLIKEEEEENSRLDIIKMKRKASRPYPQMSSSPKTTFRVSSIRAALMEFSSFGKSVAKNRYRRHKTKLPFMMSCPIFSLETFTKIISLLMATLLVLPVNGLAKCPNDCECDDDKLTVTCGEGTLDVLPITLNPAIQRLAIKHNRIKTIDSSIQFYSALTFLDLSYNDLVNIPYKTFNFQRNLSELYIKMNKIGQISNKTFAGLVSLRVLNLRGNLIAELEYGSFAPMSKLTSLDLGQNRISTIDPHAFDSLPQLQYLYLDDNSLTTVPADMCFKALPNLEQLFLGINSFMTLTAGAFQDLKKLKHLDLKGAGLHNISQEAFKGLENLNFLDLSDNRLEQIPALPLSYLKNLEFLSLGQNDFEVIPSRVFTPLKNLKGLEITGAMRLRRIESQAFDENSQLEHLNFSSNKMLNEIDDKGFQGLQHLKNVSFKDNQLSSFSEDLLPWKNLDNLDLSGNPLVCDCRVLWLHKLLLQKNISDENLDSVVCAFPEKLKEKSLSTINVGDFGCSENSSNEHFVIVSIIVAITGFIAVSVFCAYACRAKIRNLVEGNSALGHKEQEYQKTFSDEEFMTRQNSHSCNYAVEYNPHQTNYMGTCPKPVTEL